jgi:MFS family permease
MTSGHNPTPRADGQKPPPPAIFRWAVLVVISLAMFGNYYVYDAISPIADLLRDQLGFSDSQIGWLNAIYSLPNIIMVLVGGIIIDRIGVKKATVLFGVLCLIGAAITAATGEFLVMAAGRLIFGLGAESLIVSVTVGIARWFRGRELSFAFGVNLTIARLGSFLALNSPTWARPAYENWQWPLFITVGFGTFCVVGALVYWVLEDSAEKRYDLGETGETDRVEWGDLFSFPRSYMWVVLLCVTFYSAIFPFQTFAIKFFQDAHGMSREAAGALSSIITLFAMIFTPLFGLWVDRVGKRSLFMMVGSLLLVPVYLVMAYTEVDPRIPMAVMGIAFSLVPAVMWPAVAYLVEEAKLGTAYGLMTMIQNIGLFGFNVMIGWANDYSGASATNPGGYALSMWIFSVLGFLGFFFAWMLRREETGPNAHGLETITVKSTREAAGRAGA